MGTNYAKRSIDTTAYLSTIVTLTWMRKFHGFSSFLSLFFHSVMSIPKWPPLP